MVLRGISGYVRSDMQNAYLEVDSNEHVGKYIPIY